MLIRLALSIGQIDTKNFIFERIAAANLSEVNIPKNLIGTVSGHLRLPCQDHRRNHPEHGQPLR